MPLPPLITDPDVIEGYLTDASNTRGHAEALVRPRSTAEVAAILRHCQSRAIPVTVTAQRTATTGAPVPQGGWLLSTELLTAVHALDDVETGLLLGPHQDQIEAAGRFFPPDPTSRYDCSIGAAISCNASGARSFRYGATRPWIEAVTAVLPTGEVIEADRSTPIPADWTVPRWSEPAVKTAAGYVPADNLLDLLIGQEGTLAVLTRARLRLIEAPPAVLSIFAFFPHDSAVVDFVNLARSQAVRARHTPDAPGVLQPRALEYFDHRALDLARSRAPDIPEGARAAVLIEIEHNGEPPYDPWLDALDATGALVDDSIVAEDDTGLKRLHAIRHAIPASVNEQVVRNGMPKVGTDFAVPDAALADILAAYDAEDLPRVCFGHIGDNHLHLNFLPRTPDQLAIARERYKALARTAVSMGGTVSAEHGIGKIKRELLAEMVGPDVLSGFRALKRAADPAWILGRGTLLEAP
jgi:D-lactate dehydrogenase (cytochrome)